LTELRGCVGAILKTFSGEKVGKYAFSFEGMFCWSFGGNAEEGQENEKSSIYFE